MKVPGKRKFEQIFERHTKKEFRIKRDAASIMYLRYLIFMKQLAQKADAVAFSQRKVEIGADALARPAQRLLTEFSFTESVRMKALQSRPTNKSSERKDSSRETDSDSSEKDTETDDSSH